MSKLARLERPGEMAVFNPNEMALNGSKADAVIAWAKRVKDWPLLEEAVDKKIEDQTEFVRWWKTFVRRPGGKESQAINADLGELAVSEAEKRSGIKQQQVSRWHHYIGDQAAYRERLLGAEYKAAALMEPAGTNIRGTQGTGDNEWFTPLEHIERARAVLGEIDLDPASHPLAQKRILAKKYFTQKDNGLASDWHGRVWLNPPYSQPAIGEFIAKLIRHSHAWDAYSNCCSGEWDMVHSLKPKHLASAMTSMECIKPFRSRNLESFHPIIGRVSCPGIR